jgi:hypothetical protein
VTSPHLRIEELAEVLAAPDHDPRRRHAAGCARCDAQLAAYAAFVSPPEERASADVADARARLAATMKREIEGRSRAGPRSAPAPPGRLPRLIALFAAQPRPAWAALAAVLLAASILAGVQALRRNAGEDTLRGGAVGEAAFTLEARVVADAVVLHWNRVPEADGYQLSLLATDLVPLVTRPATPDTSARIDLRELAPGIHSGSLLYGRVVAMRQGRTIAASPPITFRVP